MNPNEQRNHKRTTDAIADEIVEIVAAADQRCSAIEASIHVEALKLRDLVGEERTHRLRLADEQRAYVDAADRRLNAIIAA